MPFHATDFQALYAQRQRSRFSLVLQEYNRRESNNIRLNIFIKNRIVSPELSEEISLEVYANSNPYQISLKYQLLLRFRFLSKRTRPRGGTLNKFPKVHAGRFCSGIQTLTPEIIPLCCVYNQEHCYNKEKNVPVSYTPQPINYTEPLKSHLPAGAIIASVISNFCSISAALSNTWISLSPFRFTVYFCEPLEIVKLFISKPAFGIPRGRSKMHPFPPPPPPSSIVHLDQTGTVQAFAQVISVLLMNGNCLMYSLSNIIKFLSTGNS